MELLITELSKDKFEITVKANQITKHVVYVTDEMLFNLTKNKISKKELLIFSFNFLLERETNTSILSSFETLFLVRLKRISSVTKTICLVI